ncbi:MAG: protease Lon-related BREX system protein BrxL [Thermomicrobiales bacterium]
MADLDAKVNDHFPGKVVRKDLVQRTKAGANVPIYVLEFLLGKYCASDDPAAIAAGLRMVEHTISENIIRPDQSNRAQSQVKEAGRHSFIDKVRVRLLDSEDKYWAEMTNFGNRFIHIPDSMIRRYDRLLEGGIWAQVELEYRADELSGGKIRPFFITDLQPIQLASFDFAEYTAGRAAFTTDEWIDLLMRSIGFEPAAFTKRTKLLLLSRLVPMVERNYNLVELGPRSTGKSFVYREVSPYSILISGGKTTVANLFYNMATNKMGLVGLWDVVAFDEVAGIEFGDQTAVQILKDYMESGSFSRGKEELVAQASLVFVGNINQPVEVLARTQHLFAPLPAAMQDMALIDRFHCYLPGWESPKLSNDLFTQHYGFVVDYLAEAFRELRKHNFSEVIDAHFMLGSHLNTRDARAVRKTVAGLVKLFHPDGNATRDEIREYLEFALEGRRRVKEQLKKLGAFEYYQTSFSYRDTETLQEHFVGVPEEGGRALISADPLPAGSVYAASWANDEQVGLSRIEVAKVPGGGRLRVGGQPDRAMRDAITTAYDYLRAQRTVLGIERDLDSYDLHVQVVDLMGSREGATGSVAAFIAIYSLLREQPVQPGLVVLGDMTIQGNVQPIRSLIEPLQLAMDNGARRVLVPTANRRHFLEVPGDIIESVDPVFYSEPTTAALKALGIG